MPTALLQRVRCRECNQNWARAEMSIFEGICNQCFDAHYVLCADCGMLLRRGRQRTNCNRYPCYLGGDVYQVYGVVCCHNCYCNQSDCCTNYWAPKPFGVSIATYRRIGSKRKFGVEIETDICRDREELHGCTNFGCKDDPTVNGAEFDSPILYGDEGLDYIDNFLAFAEKKNWRAGPSCGCHTHYDMREESNEHLYRIAYAYALTYRMWKRCVPPDRLRSSYCHSPGYTINDIKRARDGGELFIDFADSVDRYDYVNLFAYTDHSTFEVRLLEGTLDSDAICNWITIHCRFMDRVKKLSFHELRSQFNCAVNFQFRALVDLIGDSDLTGWLATRARYTGGRPIRGPGSVRS